MPRPHREIPSQRLAVSSTSATTESQPRRALWPTLTITAAGWLLLAYPALVLGLLSFIIMTGAEEGAPAAPGIALGILGFLAALAMLAFPLLLGLAVKVRRRSLWIASCLTGALSLAAIIYLIVEWFIPLGGIF